MENHMKNNPKRVVICRHPHSEGNAISDVGQLPDISLGKATHMFGLSPKGEEELMRAPINVRSAFPELFDAYFVSEYLRTQILHNALFPSVKPYIHEQLNEMDRGVHWFMSEEDIRAELPFEIQMLHVKGKHHHKYLGGEGVTQLRGRVRQFLMWLSCYHNNEKVFVSGHGSWMKAMWCIVTGKPYPEWDFKNCEAVVYEKDAQGELVFKDRVLLA